MIEKHLRARGIHSPGVLAAMQRVPRDRFTPAKFQDEAYADRALAISCGQTISQPYMVALMTQALELTGEETVLEVGTGSGYQTAILAELAREIISVERHGPLSQTAGELLSELAYRNLTLVVGDGTQGYAARAPYERILVTAAAWRCPPALFDQLQDGGILVAPIGSAETQILQVIRKTDGRAQVSALTACRFVPLVGSENL